MKEIRLIPALELGNKLNVDVLDFPEGNAGPDAKTRKRCGITVDYGPRDIRQLAEQGLDQEGMLAFYRQRIYDLVKINISQDWECESGMDDVMRIVRKHLPQE